MILENMSLSDKLHVRILQSKNLFTFKNLNCLVAGENKILLFSIVRYRGKHKYTYYAWYNPVIHIYYFDNERYGTYKELLDRAWEI
jgi:hypothetical protein